MSIFSKDALANKHILVTGATGGIGKEIVHIIVINKSCYVIIGPIQKILKISFKRLTEICYLWMI